MAQVKEKMPEPEAPPKKAEEKAIDEEYDEEEDDDYDPEAKQEPENISDDDDKEEEAEEKVPDFSGIQASTSQVRTRNQRQQEDFTTKSRFIGSFETDSRGLVKNASSSVDIDAIFEELKTKSESNQTDNWIESIGKQSSNTPEEQDKTSIPQDDSQPQQIKIQTSYAFAGKLITESKLVDADSAEAKAYLNSTSSITAQDTSNKTHRSFVLVMRQLPGTKEQVELGIKLKRPSLIDKFLSMNSNKKQKLSTLEKSRLDWASFVDKRKIVDDLKIHNKGGFLDKQEFLGRIQNKRDEHYQKAKEADRQRQWQLQQAQK
jgi:Bucentaur or craniofacial development.